MEYLKKRIKDITEKINLDKKSVIVIIIGFMGVILLVLSELLPADSKEEKHKAENDAFTISYSEYEKEIEGRLENLISKIDGAGAVSIMVTLDCTVENVYAQEEKQTGGNNLSYGNEYVIIKTGDGENGILLKTNQPQVRGVAVVCTGGNSSVVRQNITNTITAALGISAARVNISAMKSNNGG